METNNEVTEAIDNESLNKLTKLKVYLRSRGQQVSGNKTQLIERVKGTHKLGLKDLNCEKVQDTQLARERLVEKLQTPCGKSLLHPDYIDNWTSDVSCIPEITEKDIYNYFVYNIQTKRQLKAKVMYEDGHVYNIQVSKSGENDGHCFVRANVIQSMPSATATKSRDYRTWVILSNVTGNVHSADCGCQAGEGEGCNHISALLYALVDISDKKRGGKLASTSIKCKWNNPRKRKLTPKKSQDLIFQNVVHGKPSAAKRLVTVYDVKTSSKVDTFKEKLLKGNSNAGWLKNFIVESSRAVLPKLHNISFSLLDTLDPNSDKCKAMFTDYFKSLALSEEDCVTIECLTRNQNDSDYWMEARQERLTASNFGQIAKMKESTKPDGALKGVLGYNPFQTVHTEYGRKHEPAARRKYLRYMQKIHPGLIVKKCGLLTNTEYPYLGASPDGVVNCTHCSDPSGLLEIKCPSSFLWRMKTPEECATDPKFFCELKDQKVCLKRQHSYFYQVQGQLGISGRKWCDFVVWTCAGISVERIYADTLFFDRMVEKLKHFYVSAYIPELYTRRVKRGINHVNSD